FLRYLRTIREVNSEVLSPWIRRLPSASKARRELDWLWGDKTDARRQAFRALTNGLGRIRAVRVVSPYFDNGSAALLGNLLEELGTGTAGNRIEVWTDGPGCVARRSDYQ